MRLKNAYWFHRELSFLPFLTVPETVLSPHTPRLPCVFAHVLSFTGRALSRILTQLSLFLVHALKAPHPRGFPEPSDVLQFYPHWTQLPPPPQEKECPPASGRQQTRKSVKAETYRIHKAHSLGYESNKQVLGKRSPSNLQSCLQVPQRDPGLELLQMITQTRVASKWQSLGSSRIL